MPLLYDVLEKLREIERVQPTSDTRTAVQNIEAQRGPKTLKDYLPADMQGTAKKD